MVLSIAYSVTGYVSEASGSLLIPVENFIKEIPLEIRSSFCWKDPHGLLKRYEPSQNTDAGKWENLNTYSALYHHGYSVRASVPKGKRQKILISAIRGGSITKEAAIRHIRSLISRNQNRYPAACNRWKEDIDFINQLPDPE